MFKIVRFHLCLIAHCVYAPHILYLSVSGHVAWFHFLAIINHAAMNIGLCISLQTRVILLLDME